jgi:hypothetical protein
MDKDVIVKQMPVFKCVYKNLLQWLKLVVDDAIREIIKAPTIGQEKRVIGQLSLFINLKYI